MTSSVERSLLLGLALSLFAGCGGSSKPVDPAPVPPAPAAAGNINLIFVVSPDIEFQAPGDVSDTTGNLTVQGLQRSLLMAPFLQEQVLGNNNVTGIYALEPMSHLQTASHFPDMAAMETIQQFAMMNTDTLQFNPGESTLYTANSFHLNVSYAIGQTITTSVIAPPLYNCEGCQGIDYDDQGNDNDTLLSNLVKYSVPGYYVFSAPWDTTLNMMTVLKQAKGYNLTLPPSYPGPNNIYAITVTPAGSASLVTYNSNVTPPKTYPVLSPEPSVNTPCQATLFNYSASPAKPPVTNTNETLYLIRHAEAHPIASWENGNYVAAGQWRALALPKALQGKIAPDEVYSIDPSQAAPSGYFEWSYVRPSITAQPYAIANHLPYNLVANFQLNDVTTVTENTIDFFFNDPQFSNHKILLAWEHLHFPPLVNKLLAKYGSTQTAPAWAEGDYDSIWTVRIDAAGNMTVDNSLCEGIDSSKLPAIAPQF
jgi:hypothetical protein